MQREEVLNGKLGELLIARHPQWTNRSLHIEEKGTIRGHPMLAPDILIEAPGCQPVVLEAKRDENISDNISNRVEQRLNFVADDTGNTIEAGISLIYPSGIQAHELESASLQYAAHQLSGDGDIVRWPSNPDEWSSGSVDELADVIEIVSLSLRLISRGEQILRDSVRDASSYLLVHSEGMSWGDEIANVLHQEAGQQTLRMAVTILLNAFSFHYAIEGGSADIPKIPSLRTEQGPSRRLTVEAWERILEKNYWPIFSIARAILNCIPERIASPLLNRLDRAAENLMNVGTATFHDLAGRMFQQLITDRKFLATFYTLPTSATFLAELALDRIAIDWSDQDSIANLKVADFACGTGALLAAVQRAINRRYRRTGNDDRTIHAALMERVLIGTDIMPASAHLTASILSSAHPGTTYDKSLVHALPYGFDESLPDPVNLGSLDLLDRQTGFSVFRGLGEVKLGGKRMIGTGRGSTVGDEPDFLLEHETCDLVIMNPPFTRLVNPHDDPNVDLPAFAGFRTSHAEQEAMSARLKEMHRECGRGQGGHVIHIGSFIDLAHRKLRPGGVLALILPFVFITGHSWERARKFLFERYSDVLVVSIVSTGTSNQAFSADTAIAECVIVATKTAEGSKDVRFVNLSSRPTGFLDAVGLARSQLNSSQAIVGSTSDLGVAGVLQPEIARTMVALRKGSLVLPRQLKPVAIPMTSLGNVAKRGDGETAIHDTPPSGAFDLHPMDESDAPEHPTFPALWWHHASKKDGDRERYLTVPIDSFCTIRPRMDERAARIWSRSAHVLHSNRDFGFGSQSFAMCLTAEPSLGGRAWPNVIPQRDSYIHPLLLWSNSTLGLMMFWFHGSRQQPGRSIVTPSRLLDLPVLDVSKLTEEQLRQAHEIFRRFENRLFLPANEAYRDETRVSLDVAIFKLLNLPAELNEDLKTLRLQWCSEPSVHGGKRTRPAVDGQLSVTNA